MFDKFSKKEIIVKLLFSVFYLSLVLVFYRLGIGCFFMSLFGIPCPGCGITRACLSLLHLDFAGAVRYNPMVFSLPVLYIYFWTDGRLFGKTADRVVVSLILLGFLVSWILKLCIS